jgi:nucleoside-diphosphate-sugar epimerase
MRNILPAQTARPRILITGAAGFIGGRLVRMVSDSGWEPTTLSRSVSAHIRVDLLDADALATALSGRVFDTVIHLASPARSAPPRIDMSLEALAVENLLRALQSSIKPNFLFFSTADEYAGGPQPLSENAPIAPLTSYGAAKATARETCAAHTSKLAIPLTVFRPFSVYGPGQPSAMLIAALMRHALVGEPLAISAAEKVRDYLHVDDLCRAVLRWLKAPSAHQGAYNIGTGRGIGMTELLALFERLSGRPMNVIRDPTRGADTPLSLVADSRRAHVELEWAPQIKLEDGLAAMISCHRGASA